MLLSISGASHSLWLAHLLTLLCLGLALALFLWCKPEQSSRLGYLLVTAAFIALPGTLYSSIGIMSENLFLLLLLTTLALAKVERRTPQHWLALYLALSLAILTRSAGIAMIPALLLARSDRYMVSNCACALATLLVWHALSPLNHLPSYLDLLAPLSLAEVYQFFRLNVAQLPLAWQTYLAGPAPHLIAQVLCWLSLAGVLFFTLRQASRGRLEAQFCLCYILLLLFWPFPTDYRFLQPIVLLLLVQPLAAIGQRAWPMYLLMLIPAMLGSWEILSRASIASEVERHSRDYYLLEDRAAAAERARSYAEIMSQMSASATLIESDAIVATVKPALYVLRAQRTSVPLTDTGSPLQETCQLQARGVDYLFFSRLTSGYNSLGLRQAMTLSDYTTPVAEIVIQQTPGASLHKLNPDINCSD